MMKTKRLLYLALALALALTLGLFALLVSGEESECPLELLPGASIRLDEEHSGLRFESRILTSKLAELGEVTVGTLILPTDLKKGDIKIDTPNVLNLVGARPIEKDDGYTYFYAAIVDILPENYTRAFSAVSYIKIGEEYFYTDYSVTDNSRSICEVAAKAYGEEQSENPIVKSYLDKVLVLTRGLEILVPAEGYVSPYTVSYTPGKLSITKEGGMTGKGDLATIIIGDRTFTGGWSLDGDSLVAPYTNSYPITFKSGDEVLGTVNVHYGSLPSFSGEVAPKDGNRHTGWYPYLTEVTGPAEYEATYETPNALGVHMKLPSEVISYSLEQALINYGAEYASGRNGQKTNPFNGTSATFFLLVEEHFNPGQKEIGERILAQLRSVITSGHEPNMILGSEWSPANFASMIALAKQTPTVWTSLTPLEVEKLDFLMHLLTYAGAFATNDVNNYETTLAMNGGYKKTWNPNYRLTNVIPMLAAGEYFGGAAAVNAVLAAYDHASVLEACEEYGFVNALSVFSKPTAELLESGGVAYDASGKALGSGAGVRAPYLYHTYSLDESEKILNDLLGYTFSGGKVISNYLDENGTPLAYIYFDPSKGETLKTSPYEGKFGMYFEFAGSDASGIRSSSAYCLADFNMTTVALLLGISSGSYDLEGDMSQELMNMLYIGNSDLIYKLRQGYQSYANGKQDFFSTLGTYAAGTALGALWEQLLFTRFVVYEEITEPYAIKYVLPGGSAMTERFATASVTLSRALASGYVWYDGKKYYNGGGSYEFAGEGEVTLEAVKAIGIVDGAYKIGSQSSTLTLSQGATSGASFNGYTVNSMSGKILTVLTISSPSGAVPNYMQYSHKLAGASTDSLIFGIRSSGSELQTASGSKICNYGGSEVTLAIAYDTAGASGKIYLKNGDAWTFVTDFAIGKGGAVGRLGYIYLTTGYGNTAQTRTLHFKVTHYYGFTEPFSDMP